MAFIPTILTARVALEFTLNSQAIVNTLWFEAGIEFDAAKLLDLAQAVAAWAATSLLPNLAAPIALFNVNATGQASGSEPSVDYTLPSPVFGSVAQPTVPPQVASVVTFQTPLRGRSFRGRNYVGGIPTTSQAAPGVLTAGAQGAIAAAYAALTDVEVAEDVTHVVVSHFAAGSPRAAGVTTPVTTYRVDAPMDTQRRRSVGRGI